MKIEALHIDDPALLRDIEALVERTGMSAERALALAVRDKLGEPGAVHQISVDERVKRVNLVLARIDRLPKTGRMLTDEDLYDQDGLPR